jgi:hypothetical protein
MKSLSLIVTIAVLTFVLSHFLPWWICGIVSFVACYLWKTEGFIGFTVSLLSVFVVWCGKAFFADQNFDIPMSSLLGALLGNVSGGASLFLTGLIGGIAAGLAGWLGGWTRTLSTQKP